MGAIFTGDSLASPNRNAIRRLPFPDTIVPLAARLDLDHDNVPDDADDQARFPGPDIGYFLIALGRLP